MVDAVDAGNEGIKIERKNQTGATFTLSSVDLEPIGPFRQGYIKLLKQLVPITKKDDWNLGKDSTVKKGGLSAHNQSLLNLIELQGGQVEELQIARLLRKMEKVPLSMAIGEHIGYRPRSVAFHIYEWKEEDLMGQIDELINSSGAVYLKRNKGFHGNAVVQVSKNGDQYRIVNGDGTSLTVADLGQYTLTRDIHRGSDIFIAEEAIPIAQTSDERTWEVRLLPPFNTDYAYCKVGAEENVVNNTSQGGEKQVYQELLYDVIRVRYPNDPEKITQIAQDFMTTATKVAAQVKELTDDFQIQVAKAFVKPEDLKDPSKYDEVMKFCFSGNFLTVDITGVWNDNGQLVPRVMGVSPN